MMIGNLSKSKELLNLMNQYPNHTFPIDIPEHNQTAYCFIGVRAKNNGLAQTLQIHQFCKSSADWMKLKDEFKTPQYMGNYHSVIMIHNPTIVAKPVVKPDTIVPKKKRVTPPVKKKIASMLSDGASVDVIAEELDLTVKQVENNI
jgi:DNA-binding NarL/FixJ family response regulator